MDRVRWGMIGCGDVTEVKSGPAFSLIEGSELVAVMRRDAVKAEDYARRHGVPKWYSDARDLIADPGVNAIYVATPPDSHLRYAIEAAKAGKPAYVEKPMALNSGECSKMVSAFRRREIPLFVAYYRRALPRFLKIKELLESGKIGEARSVRVSLLQSPRQEDAAPGASWRVDPRVSGGGKFVDMASHTLDFLDFLFGPIAEARGFAVNQAGLYEAEDNVAAVFRFSSGVTGSGSWIFTADAEEDRVDIIGSRGRLSFSSFSEEPIRFDAGRKTVEYSIPNPKHVQEPLIESVVAELLGKGACPSTGETASRTTLVMDSILRGYYKGR
jgi:1,5-anhydro-D-fructose reductase (1,5-anhydro-D-mannitol-forming)